MKKLLLSWGLCILLCSAQAQFLDSFGDGNFTATPTWQGDISSFFVNGNKQLQSVSSTIAQTIYLSASNTLTTNTCWSFSITLNFDPSTNNQIRIYLTSTDANLKNALNGYFLQIGESGDKDGYHLYKQSGTALSQIIKGSVKTRTNSGQLRANVKVFRDAIGNWEVQTAIDNSPNYITEGSGFDDSFTTSVATGVWFKYTTSNADKLYIDDFQIATWTSSTTLQGHDYKEVVINEIFADPSPSVGLPNVEFVELWNISGKGIDLANWSFSDGNSTATLSSFVLEPNAFILLCSSADIASLSQYGNVMGLSPWPSLNNASDNLYLKDKTKNLIHKVSYNYNWHTDSEKKAGGYTLELIEPKNNCVDAQNYTSSLDSEGGTPNRLNSVYQSHKSSQALSTSANISGSSIFLQFSQSIDSLQATNLHSYNIYKNSADIASVIVHPKDFSSVELQMKNPLAEGTSFSLAINNVCTCDFSPKCLTQTIELVAPHNIQENDIALSEVLFNPQPDGVDFVEIYNPTDKTFDLKQLLLTSFNSKGVLSTPKTITTQSFLLYPKQYIALTTDTSDIKLRYPKSQRLLQIASLPSMPDEFGSIVLIANDTIIDQLNYSTTMHHRLLKEKEGVSLERISFEQPSNIPFNFTSAASTVGYATPGYQNSQSVTISSVNSLVKLDSKTFSPDDDGFEDTLNVYYNVGTSDWLANVKIYNQWGELVYQIMNANTLSANGYFYWDGVNTNQQKAPVGIYLLHCEFYHPNGNKKTEVLPFVLAKKLN